MRKKKTYAIFGLGKYGMSLAQELVENGMDVIAVDSNPDLINKAVSTLPICKCADVTNAEVIEQLGIADVDMVIICMSDNFESTIMALSLCKQVGVKKVIAKCKNEMHRDILLRIGADKVIFPEKEAGIRFAKNLLTSGFLDLITLSNDISMAEIDIKSEWIGQNIMELNLRKKYGFNIVGIKTSDGKVNINIQPEEVITEGMNLIVIANTSKLEHYKQ